MTLQRIRPFNTKVTYPEQNLDNDLAHAVVTRGGRTIWFRGACPQDLDTAINLGSHDPADQTHKVMQNIKPVIEEAGGKMEHQVKLVGDAAAPAPIAWATFAGHRHARELDEPDWGDALPFRREVTQLED